MPYPLLDQVGDNTVFERNGGYRTLTFQKFQHNACVKLFRIGPSCLARCHSSISSGRSVSLIGVHLC